MTRFIRVAVIALMLIMGLVAVSSPPASAHTPNISATCAGLQVNLVSYGNADVTVKINNATVDSYNVRGNSSRNFSFPQDGATSSWSVKIDEKRDGNQYDATRSGSVGPCGETPPDTSEQKIAVCHATGSATNPFTKVEVSKASFYTGHREHAGDIYPAGSYEKGRQTYSWPAQGDQSLLATDCVKPPNHNWTYNVSCVGVSGERPNTDSVDSNIRIKNLVTGETRTFNYHGPDSAPAGPFTYTLAMYGVPSSWTHFAIQWVQVNGTNYHWEGNLVCGEPPVFEPETQREERTRDGQPNCENSTVTVFTEERTRTETADGVWGEWSSWTVISEVTREATARECPPTQPEPLIREVPGNSESCELGGVTTWNDVYTTPYVWDADTAAWVLGDETGPVREDDAFDPYTDDEYFDECAPEQPDARVEYSDWVDSRWECEDTTTVITRTKSVTPFVWDMQIRDWVAGQTDTTQEQDVRELTDDEIEVCPPGTPEQPQPIVQESSSTQIDCESTEQVTVHTTITTGYVLDESTNQWVKGEPVTTTDETSVPYTGEDCAKDNPKPGPEPKPAPPADVTTHNSNNSTPPRVLPATGAPVNGGESPVSLLIGLGMLLLGGVLLIARRKA